MTDRSGICGNRKVEDIEIFHLKNFGSFLWRWLLLSLLVQLLLGSLQLTHIVMGPVRSTTYIILMLFVAWVWAWPAVIKRWRNRVLEDAMAEAVDVEYEELEADTWGLPVCPHCKKDIFPPIEVDTTTQCPHCGVLLYPLVYRPTK